MKKLGYLMGAALLTLGSCTNEINEEGFVDKANTISFNAYSNKTRAYENGDINSATQMQVGSFGVVGYKSGNTIYLGSTDKAIEQTWQSTAWEYATSTDLKYWPDGKMDFYAYFPYTANDAAFAESTTSTEGTVMTINNATGNQDVLFASAINQNYQERVPLTFHHAFSKINSVNIKVTLNDVDVVVSKVEFINTQSTENSKVLVNKSGKASYGTATGATSTCGQQLASAVTINSTGEYKTNGYTVWTNAANKYILATNGTETNNVTGTNKVMWDGKNTGWANDEKLSTKGLVCLKITGKVKTHSGENYIIGNASEDGVIYIPLKGTNHTSVGAGNTTDEIDHFFAGKRYTYNIVMRDNVGYHDNGDPILKPILFNASVTGWDDVTVTITL